MVGFDEILRFDPEQIQQIFALCSTHQGHCTSLGDGVNSLSDLHTWSGEAADAAKNSAGKTRVDIDAHSREAGKIAAAARDCYGEGVAMRQVARQCQADADSLRLVIDPASGKVSDPHPPTMTGWTDTEKFVYGARILSLQTRVNNVIASAERFDDDLAAAINAADGSIPTTPQGEGAHVNLADRPANQVAAFRQLYGHDPVTPNDWRMAEAVDPHTYDPKNKGHKSNLTAGRFPAQPGRGVVSLNAFIPRSDAFNFGGNDLGDNRGFSAGASAERSRAGVFVDYEHGVIIARQNPSVREDGQVKVGTPDVDASRGPNGQVNVNYRFSNPFSPGGDVPATLTGEVVRGTVAIPGASASPSINGQFSNYPALESYHYPASGEPQPLAQYWPGGKSTIMGGSSFGPMINLPLTHDIGDTSMYPQLEGKRLSLDPYSSRIPNQAFLDGTQLGSTSSPPTVRSRE